MLSVLWGNLRQGQLARLPYLGYTLLVGLTAILIGVGLWPWLTPVETPTGSSTELSLILPLPVAILLLIATSVLGFAGLNLMAKRLRHIGLPGWPTTAALTLLVMAIGYGWSLPAANGFQLLIWLTLLVLPKGLFGQAANAEPL